MKCFYACLLTVFFSIHLFAQDSATTISTASRQLKPIVIDGMDNDWDSSLPFTDDKNKILYRVSNNDSAVFIFLKTMDLFTRAKMIQAGFHIALNTEGKKKQTATLYFPLKPEEDFQMPPGGLADLDGALAFTLIRARQFEVEGFANGNGVYQVADQSPSQVKVMMGVNASGALIYEACIPLSALYKKGRAASDAVPLMFSYSLEGLPRPGASGAGSVPAGGFSGRRPMPPGPGAAGARPGGGAGAPPGANRPPDQNMDNLFESSKTWQAVLPAKHS